MEIDRRFSGSIGEIQPPSGISRAKPEIKDRQKHRENTNGNSPRSTSSNPSPERIDENVSRRIAAY
jgi:hypothetical protein